MIWQARNAAGISLRKLEASTGISKSALHKMENGREIPNLLHLELIAKALKVPMSTLYDSEYK